MSGDPERTEEHEMGKGEEPITVVFMVGYCCGLKNPEEQASGLSLGRE